MAQESFTITIKKNGEIWVKLAGMKERRIRHYKDILSELVGPIIKEMAIKEDDLPPVDIKLKEKEDDSSQQKIIRE